MPAHPIALALIRAAGVPLAAPSANRFTELSPTTAEHVRRSLGSDVDYILDGGPCTVGIESTVLVVSRRSTGSQPILLRPGGISRTELEAMIGPIVYGRTIRPRLASRARHAPAPLQPADHFISSDEWKIARSGPRASARIYLQHRNPPSRTNVTIHQMPQSAADYAAALYEVLHQADAGNYNWIAVDLPPSTPEWEAIQDRSSTRRNEIIPRAAANAARPYSIA